MDAESGVWRGTARMNGGKKLGTGGWRFFYLGGEKRGKRMFIREPSGRKNEKKRRAVKRGVIGGGAVVRIVALGERRDWMGRELKEPLLAASVNEKWSV